MSVSLKSIPKMNFSAEALEKMRGQKKYCEKFMTYNDYRNDLIGANGDNYMIIASAIDSMIGSKLIHNAIVNALKKEKASKNGKLEPVDISNISKLATY